MKYALSALSQIIVTTCLVLSGTPLAIAVCAIGSWHFSGMRQADTHTNRNMNGVCDKCTLRKKSA